MQCNTNVSNTSVFWCLKGDMYSLNLERKEENKNIINKVKILDLPYRIQNYVTNVLQSFLSIGLAGLYINLHGFCL